MGSQPDSLEALSVSVDETQFRESQNGTIESPGDIALFPFDVDAGETVVISVTPDLGFEPDVRLREPENEGLTYAAGFEGLAEPWLIVVPDTVDGRYELIVSGVMDSTGGFTVLVDRTSVTDVALGTPVTGTLSTSSPVDVFRMNLLENDLTALQLIPDETLGVATYAVFGPDGSLVSSGFGGSIDGTGLSSVQSAVFKADASGAFVAALTGFDGSSGEYQLAVDRAEFRWDVEALIPASAKELTMESYNVVSGETSGTCSDWRDGLRSEEGYILVPRESQNHYIWMWSARFDSPAGQRAYVESYGDGCPVEDEVGNVTTIHEPMRLRDDVTWYVTTMVNNGKTIINSVGVIATADEGVAEAQVVLLGTDGSLDLIVIGSGPPYGSEEALAIAIRMENAVVAIANDL
jgi:hypothetical protein